MELKEIGITERKISQFAKANILTVEDLIRYWPRKYSDRSELTGIMPKDQESVFVMHVSAVNRKYYSKTIVEAIGTLANSDKAVKVVWFNQDYIYEKVKFLNKQDVLISGKVTYVPGTSTYSECYQVVAPTIFSRYKKDDLRIYPVYRKIKGMSVEYLEESIKKAAIQFGPIEDTIPAAIRQSLKLVSYQEMVNELHWPTSREALSAALRRKRMEDLLYFAFRIELNRRHAAVGSPFNLPVLKTMKAVQKGLPFELTEDQSNTLQSAIAFAREGKRLNALIQGDVGCGKTIVALLLMIAFAENGYQAALMAPTKILARQHYEDLVKLVEPYGINVAFISEKCGKVKEQRERERALWEGEYQLIVGTQALLSESYQFKNLALIIEDEEHKYGVLQRKHLADKAAQGTHTVMMSATPIPRTLAQIIHGNDLQLFSIKTKPSGRKPVKTGIASSMESVFNYILSEVNEFGRQVYAVCPMISSNEKTEGVASAEDIYKQYCQELSQYGVKVEMVTGKTKKQDADEIFNRFNKNETSVLISTTVIEVGVNVPNSTGIIIHNAERFGLAQLHQLRGRVGRGADRGVCVLVSEERDNERLKALCELTDGFRIAEMDLKLRGAGDLIGQQQSGNERYLSLALSYPEEYEQAKDAVSAIMDSDDDCAIFNRAYNDFNASKEL